MSANVPSVIAKRAVCVPAPCRRHGLQFRDLMMILLAASLVTVPAKLYVHGRSVCCNETH